MLRVGSHQAQPPSAKGGLKAPACPRTLSSLGPGWGGVGGALLRPWEVGAALGVVQPPVCPWEFPRKPLPAGPFLTCCLGPGSEGVVSGTGQAAREPFLPSSPGAPCFPGVQSEAHKPATQSDARTQHRHVWPGRVAWPSSSPAPARVAWVWSEGRARRRVFHQSWWEEDVGSGAPETEKGK